MNRTYLTILLSICFCFSVWSQQIDIQQLQKKADEENTATLYNQLAVALLNNNKPYEAKESASKALNMATAKGNQQEEAKANQTLGLIAQVSFDYTSAVRYFLKAQEGWRALENRNGLAQSIFLVGNIYYLEDEYKQALPYLNESVELYEKTGNRQGIASVKKVLGDVYYKQKFIGKAKASYGQAFNLYIENEEFKKAAGLARFLGKLSLDVGEYESAQTYFRQSLDLNGALEDLPNIAVDYKDLALVGLAQGHLDEAHENNQVSFDLRTQLNDTFGLAESHKNFGLIALANKDKATANKELQKAGNLLKQSPTQKGTPIVYTAIEKAFVQLGKYDEAYQFQAAAVKSNEILAADEKAKTLYELTVRHNSALEAEKKQKKIALLEKDKVAGNRIKWFLFAVIGLIAGLFSMLFKNYQRKKKANLLLQEKNDEIEWQKEEIDRKNVQLVEKAASLDLLNTKLVDEMAERESMEKSSFARDSFLAMMSHEMRTPINIIVGLTHLLLEDNPHNSQKEALRKLQFSANNLVVFINDVLDYSKIEAGKLVMQNRSFALSKVVEEVKNWSITQAKEKNVSLNFEIDKKIPEKLVGDPVRLNQIITDLISNSLNYTENGYINTKINLHKLNSKELTLFIQIEDNGKGIEQDKLKEMFKNFTRDPNADLYDGVSTSGLELAITKRLVDLQNGKIEANSILGEGCTYKMFLPYTTLSEPKMGTDDEKKVISYNFMVGKNVLVVEDNKINQLVVRKMLTKIGMNVTTADDGLKALDAIQNNGYFDLVLMDIQMPNMDGYRATAEIRKSPDPKISQMPIIALTASAYLSACLSKNRQKIRVVSKSNN